MKEKRDEFLIFRVTKEERRKVEEEAEESALSLSNYLRKKCL